ncbi:hypothetical protein F5Y12DRAFT_715817 [Xylaria sp. FL1777]|nr:hypothetical protein F5Y12DRAFT_715817 [Xylaria sp. FL1777]
MVGFVERFRKPKLPIVLGSPPRDGVVYRQVVSRPQNITSPVLRNFSYPTNIANNNPPLSTPPAWEEPPSTWDQLGEICSFSPSITPRTRQDRTARLEDPFFYTTDRTPYKEIIDLDGKFNSNTDAKNSTDSVCWTHQTVAETRQRRSTSLGLPPSEAHSLGHHKTSSSFDASRLLAQRASSLERPMSSSSMPLIDTRLPHSTSTTTKPSYSPLLFGGDRIEEYITGPERAAATSYALSALYTVEMGSIDSTSSPQGLQCVAPGSEAPSGDRQCSSRASESYKRKGKEGRSRWFSQLKEWVSVSEPSTQALKNYKKDTYDKAGIALDDPLANAKLHLPVASLPPDAIKPGGRGPEPEEIVMKKAIQRKKARELLTGTSQESRSSASYCSSPTSVTASAPKDSD